MGLCVCVHSDGLEILVAQELETAKGGTLGMSPKRGLLAWYRGTLKLRRGDFGKRDGVEGEIATVRNCFPQMCRPPKAPIPRAVNHRQRRKSVSKSLRYTGIPGWHAISKTENP